MRFEIQMRKHVNDQLVPSLNKYKCGSIQDFKDFYFGYTLGNT